MKLQHRLAIPLLLVSIFSLALISVLYYFYNLNKRIEIQKTALEKSACIISRTLDDFLKQEIKRAKSLGTTSLVTEYLNASNAEYQKLTSEERAEHLKSMEENWNSIIDENSPLREKYLNNELSQFFQRQRSILPEQMKDVFLTNVYGTLVASSSCSIAYSYGHTHWWKESFNEGNGKTFIDDEGYTEGIDERILGVSIPIFDGNSLAGILRSNIRIDNTIEHIISLSTDIPDIKVLISQSFGTIAFEKGVHPFSAELPEELKEIVCCGKEGSEVVRCKIHGDSLIGFSHSIISLGSDEIGFGWSTSSTDDAGDNLDGSWVVIVSMPLNSLLIPFRKNGFKQLAVLSLISIIMIFVVLFIANRAVRPMTEFTNFAKQIGKGEFEKRLPIPHGKEFRNLAISLNLMVENLQSSTTSLSNLQEEMVEREKIELALRESESSLKRSHRIANLGSWKFDLKTRRVIASKEAKVLYGLSDGTIHIEDVQSMTRPEYRRPLDLALKNLIEHGATYDIEFEIIRSDGVLRNMHSVAEYIPEQETVVGIIQDITDRKELETRLRQMEKMDAIGQLAGGIAHDFNNQLAAIMGYCSIMLDLELPSKQRNYLEKIMKSTQRASDLTKQLLAFSRKGQYQLVPVDVNQYIQDLAEILEHSIDKLISVELNLSDQRAFTKGDPTQIQNALLNLALNARDAMPDGGKVTFKTSIVTLDKSECETLGENILPGDYVSLSVADTGTGIDKKDLEHIFEPFFTTKKLGKGTGMGLAAVYGTVEHHGGAITVTSSLGKGTVFTIYLPYTSEKPVSDKSTRKSIVKGNKAHILLVDDEDLIRDLGVDILEGLGYTVHTESNGKGAVKYFKSHHSKIDMVILDMVMPEMNGEDTFNELRKIDPDVKVVLASGYSINGIPQQMIENGAVEFLHKPFTLSELAEITSQVLAKER